MLTATLLWNLRCELTRLTQEGYRCHRLTRIDRALAYLRGR